MFGGAGARVRGRLLRDRGRDPNAGGDHGTPLVLTAPPGDEGVDSGGQSGEGGEGGIKLDIGIPIDFGGDDTGDVPPQGGYDPSEWVRDSSGMTYRSPTNHEMERNGWDARTILVVPVAAELTALRNAALTTLLHLPVWEVGDRPLTDLRVTPFQLGRNASQAMPFILAVYRASQVSRRTIAPIVNLYSSPGLESGTLGDAALVVVASDRGGIEAQGLRQKPSIQGWVPPAVPPAACRGRSSRTPNQSLLGLLSASNATMVSTMISTASVMRATSTVLSIRTWAA